MSILKDLLNEYNTVKNDDLTLKQLENIKECLIREEINAEITSSDIAYEFVCLLQKFREALAKTDELNGKNYHKLLKSMLSVGEDGIYSDSLHFLFELIQNVDDCDYLDENNCELDIHFNFNRNIITLSYNEKGFSAFNVFAVTGIAEAAKNVSGDKIEIGEKGIGFKSVFGVADWVLIESGWFSFELHKDNFTIPIPRKTSDFLSGTRITLYISNEKVREIYKKLENQYYGDYLLFSNNPLLFLNKLSRLRMYNDSWDNMEFRVTRSVNSVPINTVKREDGVILSVDMTSRTISNCVTKEIKCIRYTLPVLYSRQAFQSRYGDDTKLGIDGKRINLSVVVPYPEYIKEVRNGSLYSFLPTKVGLTVPIVCHVPFKLDMSREYVDSQNKNLWFTDSCEYLNRLLDYMYNDLKKIVKSKIVHYLCEENLSLFNKINDKVQCLYDLEQFQGYHFLSLPLFYTETGEYCSAADIITIAADETSEPSTVYGLIGSQQPLFLPPSNCNVKKYGITVISGVDKAIFGTALSFPDKTKECLDYLCSQKTLSVSLEKVEAKEYVVLTIEQIKEIVSHEKILELFEKETIRSIKEKSLPFWEVDCDDAMDIRDCLEEFDVDDLPSAIIPYLSSLDYACCTICSPHIFFFASKNVLLLSGQDRLLSSLSDFCEAIDKKNTLSMNIKLRSISQELDRLDQENNIVPEDYLKELIKKRKTEKTVLGDSYESYINQILQAGADPKRFINELLQNADDCKFASEVNPTFSLECQGDKIISRCNEKGFSNANVRSITDIGKSTKNKFENDTAIGEKGTGFKSVFAIASSVSISSNGFNFKLTDKTPTIPIILKIPNKVPTTSGTTMSFDCKEGFTFSTLEEDKVLQLCLFLRKLRKITLMGNVVEIVDEDNKRIITINGKRYSYTRFVHTFDVNDAEATKVRMKNGREINKEQRIVFLRPEGAASNSHGCLYCGLPTNIDINVAINIDAPFMLISSREYVLEDNRWNEIVKDELYKGLIDLLLDMKEEIRADVLSLIAYIPSVYYGNYYNYQMFENSYLNQNISTFIQNLKYTRFLPTFDHSVFVSPADSKRYPPVVNYTLSKGDSISVSSQRILDVPEKIYDVALSGLDCVQVCSSEAIRAIKMHIDKYITSEQYREMLYSYLKKPDIADGLRESLRDIRLIPVYSISGNEVEFVEWTNDKIFTKPDTTRSEESYYILNENMLSRHDCEVILGVSINEMDSAYENGRYREALKSKISVSFKEVLYSYLLSEFNSGRLGRYGCMGDISLLMKSEDLPMKNAIGTITTKRLYVGDEISDLFFGSIIGEISVSKECREFAKELGCKVLSDIHYDDIYIRRQLTDDDIETFYEEYFTYSAEILSGYVNDHYVSDELITKHNLRAFCAANDTVSLYIGGFPNKKIVDINRLRQHIADLWTIPRRIERKEETRLVQKILINGDYKGIDSKELRNETIRTYSPDDGICFCQMCKMPKAIRNIEVNNIQTEPQYYWAETRIALCLECSKLFEELRSNSTYYERFLLAIKDANPDSDEPIEIQMADKTITFTQTHLAEIQEILRLIE